jgi:hypothetical protein
MSIEYTIHPAAAVFPMLADEALNKLAADIKANGLMNPIVRMGDVILDGRNRLEACSMANVVPSYREIQVPDPVAYIVSANIHRRHLTTQQRAFIAAKLANLGRGAPVGNQNAAKTKAPNGAFVEKPPQTTIEQTAKDCGVSPRSVDRAKKVLDENPEAYDAVMRGEKPPKAAKKNEDQDMTSKTKGDYWLATALGAYSEASGNRRSEHWIKQNLKPVLTAQLEWFGTKDPRALLTDEEVADVVRVVAGFVERENGEKSKAALEKEAEETKSALSKTAQERLESAISVHMRLIDRDFDERVRQAVLKELDTEILPKYAAEYERYKRFVDTYKGVLTYSEYKMLKGFLHPDHHPENEEKAAKLFRIITEKEDLLCGLKEADKANRPGSLPKTVAEMMARRRMN